jgi:hypothetical protein
MQCTNKLKQLTLASHNYHDIYEFFPINAEYDRISAFSGRHVTWLIGVLPFIEQQALAERLPYLYFTAADEEVAQTVSVVFCVHRTVSTEAHCLKQNMWAAKHGGGNIIVLIPITLDVKVP